MIKKLSITIDITFLLLIVALFSVYTYLFMVPNKGIISEYVLVFLLFILIILSYFTNMLIALVASAIMVFVFGSVSIYMSFKYSVAIDNSYFWIIMYPITGLISGRLGDRILTLVDKSKDLEARVASYLSYDEVTGFGNLMALHQYLRKILSSAKRHNYNVSLLAVELKYYKGLEAKHGKARFKQIVKGLSNVIHEDLRLEDSPYRIDDKRFIVVLESTDLSGANIVRDRLKSKLKEPLKIDTLGGKLNVKINTRMSTAMYSAENDMDENTLVELVLKELEYDVE